MKRERIKTNTPIVVLILMLLFPFRIIAQDTVFSETFESRDMSRWSGDTMDFGFLFRNENTLLKLNADSAGSSWLSAPAGDPYGIWEIFLELDFSPSSNNKLLIYLLSDSPVLNDPVNGYVLSIGENGADDRIRLFRSENGSLTNEILQSSSVVADGGTMRIRIERDLSGLWKLGFSRSYDILPVAEAQGTDNELGSAGWFGFRADYTSSNTDAFLFDFAISPRKLRLTNILTIATDQLSLSFNLSLDAQRLSEAQFDINDQSASVLQVDGPAPDSLLISLPKAIPSGPASLRIRNLYAANGQKIADTLLTFMVYDKLLPGDLLISEFMKDPPGSSPEYLELYNSSEKYLNLAGLKLGDNRSLREIRPEPVPLLPLSYLVFTPDSAALVSEFGTGNYISFSLPSLNNGSDEIRIYDPDERLLDSLAYTDEWGVPDSSLERISFDVPAHYKENWQVSKAGNGGSPGRPNDADLDTIPPDLLYIEFLSSRSFILHFSERISEPDELVGISIRPVVTLNNFSVINNTVTVYLLQDFTDRQTYEITAEGWADIFGNRMGSRTEKVRYLRFSEAQKGDVIINEFRNAGGTGEFVELYNPTDNSYDLSGWQIHNEKGEQHLIPDRSYLASGEYLVAGDPDNDTGSPLSINFKENQDLIILKDPKDNIIDRLGYDPDWGPENGSSSLEKRDPETASADRSQWASNKEGAHSAGYENSVFERDVHSPKILIARRTGSNAVEVIFSEFVQKPEIILLEGEPISDLNFDPDSASMLQISTPDVSQRRSEFISIPSLIDIKANEVKGQSAGIIQSLKKEDLIINEIMFDPLQDPEDGIPDQSEYIEVYNRQDFPVYASWLFLHHKADENGRISPLLPDRPDNKYIPGRSYFLLYADENGSEIATSGLGSYFSISERSGNNSAAVKRSSLGLSADSDEIYLSHSRIGVLDSLFYSGDWHNPNLYNTKGIALERISADVLTGDPENWSSHAGAAGGSPLAVNSIYSEHGITMNENKISISPNPFSPNGDGFEDHTIISYSLKEQDHMLRVRIFDRYGRMVKDLSRSQSAGVQGNIIWDGTDSSGRTNYPGLYIILFEASDQVAGRQNTIKKTVALAGPGYAKEEP